MVLMASFVYAVSFQVYRQYRIEAIYFKSRVQVFSLTYQHLWWLLAYHNKNNLNNQLLSNVFFSLLYLFINIDFCLRCHNVVSWKLLIYQGKNGQFCFRSLLSFLQPLPALFWFSKDIPHKKTYCKIAATSIQL